MKRSFLLIFAGLALFALAACQANTQATPAASEPTIAEVVQVTEAPSSTEAAPATEEAPASSGGGSTVTVSFAKDVMPLLEKSCLGCHGGQRTSKGFSVKTYDTLIAGGQSGAAIVPGDAANSNLVKLIQASKMPKRGDKLTAEQLQLIIDWINAGAQNN